MKHRPVWYLNRVLQYLTGWIVLPADQVDRLVAVAQNLNMQLLAHQDLLERVLQRQHDSGASVEQVGEERRLH